MTRCPEDVLVVQLIILPEPSNCMFTCSVCVQVEQMIWQVKSACGCWVLLDDNHVLCLCVCVQTQQITPQLALQVLLQFDKAINTALASRVRNRVNFRVSPPPVTSDPQTSLHAGRKQWHELSVVISGLKWGSNITQSPSVHHILCSGSVS